MSAPAVLRVLHVVETLPGGPAAYLNEILPWQIEQAGRGCIGLLAPEGQFGHLAARSRDGLIEYPYPRSGRNATSLWTLCRALQRRLAEHAPDVVHAHCSFAGAVCRLRKLPAPLIYCPHGWAFSRECAAPLRGLYRWIERRLQTQADAIIAISEHEREQALAAGLEAERVTTIRHGLRPLTQTPPPRPCRPRDAPLALLFIGRLDRQKGLDWLIDAIAAIPAHRVHLTVAGAAVIDAPRQRVMPDHVRYLGWLTPEQIAEQLDRADALIVPSRWEGFGLVAIEAMRRGVPVLGSNRGALPEVIGNAGLVFDLDRPRSLQALLDALTPDRLSALGEAGRERFAAEFCAERMNTQTWSLYESVLAGRAVASARSNEGDPG